MNGYYLRSKKEAIQLGELCNVCYKAVGDDEYATWCQTNEKMCLQCVGTKCDECGTTIKLLSPIYVLDGMPECRPLCEECMKTLK